MGSGAETAGLQSGDLIVGIDGQKIVEPTDLTNFLRTKGVGEKATVKFDRDGKEFEVEIVFGQWE
jgi:serine protease Do